jgi:hypothetical protein
MEDAPGNKIGLPNNRDIRHKRQRIGKTIDRVGRIIDKMSFLNQHKTAVVTNRWVVG